MVSSPLLQRLPSVEGSSLSRQRIRLPEHVAGKPAVLLVAYRRGAQEDVDRWMSFLANNWPQVPLYEVPTIAGALWRPLAGWIDSGMRGGVPDDKWSSVVTLYGEDAARLRDFLGDQRGYSTSVVVLDAKGQVVWLNAEGYSDERGRELSEILRRLIG